MSVYEKLEKALSNYGWVSKPQSVFYINDNCPTYLLEPYHDGSIGILLTHNYSEVGLIEVDEYYKLEDLYKHLK